MTTTKVPDAPIPDKQLLIVDDDRLVLAMVASVGDPRLRALGELFLADFHQPRAFFIAGQQRFKRQINRFHAVHDVLKFFEGCLKRHAALGRVLGLGWF